MAFPVDFHHVTKAEDRLGVRLPPLYRDWLTRSNGGELEIDGEPWWLLPVADDSDRKRWARTWDDIVKQTETAREWPGFPQDAVAIAHDGAGNRLVFRPESQDPTTLAGAVYRWERHTGEVLWVTDEIVDLL